MDLTEIGRDILAQMLPVMGALLMALASWALHSLQKKLGVELNAKANEAILGTVRQGIAIAEERAAQAAKANVTDDDRKAGAQKAAWAAAFVEKQWPKLASDDVDDLIHSELARLKGVGATGDKAL